MRGLEARVRVCVCACVHEVGAGERCGAHHAAAMIVGFGLPYSTALVPATRGNGLVG